MPMALHSDTVKTRMSEVFPSLSRLEDPELPFSGVIIGSWPSYD